MKEILDFLNKDYQLVTGVSLSIMNLIVLIIMLAIAKVVLKLIESIVTKKLPTNDSLNFKVIFTLSDSFKAQYAQSDIRFNIDKLFKENNISIPFPQRDVHLIK